MTPAQLSTLCRALHDIAGAHQLLSIAAQLAVDGKYSHAQLDAARVKSSARMELGNELVRNVLANDAEIMEGE